MDKESHYNALDPAHKERLRKQRDRGRMKRVNNINVQIDWVMHYVRVKKHMTYLVLNDRYLCNEFGHAFGYKYKDFSNRHVEFRAKLLVVIKTMVHRQLLGDERRFQLRSGLWESRYMLSPKGLRWKIRLAPGHQSSTRRSYKNNKR